ncbi:hypothetical protein ACFE04_013783 [Oxalis oulophora]
METNLLWYSVGVLAVTCVFMFGIVKNLNEWYYVSCRKDGGESLPPGDMGWPLVGSMWQFFRAFKSGDPDSFIYNMVKSYSRTGIYRTYLFGGPTIIVCSPETCKPVYADEENFELGYPPATKKLTGRRSFHSISSTEHKRLRKLTTSPINGHEALAMYIDHIETIVVHSLEQWANMETPIEFLNEMRHFAFRVITHIFLGSDGDSVVGSMSKYYSDLNAGMKVSAINIPGFAFYRALQARKLLVKILQGRLDESRGRKGSGQSSTKHGMIDLLMEVEDENGGKLEDEDITDLLLVFLLAGHESSAHGGMWAILYLHEHPEILRKAKDEQLEIIKRRPSTQKGLTLKEVKQMSYLAKVIDETLRRTNVSLCNFRQAKVDVNLSGYTIPKGWKVLIWNRGVHMDPENYSNPEEFDPSRWDTHIPRAGSFIPFGLGSRICPGADLAKLEITIFLHHFLLNYKLELVNPGSKVTYLPIPRPVDNCLAKIIKQS